jgi:FG-GAP-like repeat
VTDAALPVCADDAARTNGVRWSQRPMRRPLFALIPLFAAVVAATVLAGCLRKPTYAACEQNPDCAAAGATAHCEANHRCSADDPLCPSGRRYDPSAGDLGGVCVDDQGPDAAMIDTAPGGPPDAPSALGLECIKGGKRAAAGTCATDVCGVEPRCCSEQWNAVCVRLTETLCKRSCSTMAFVGGVPYAAVVDTATWKVLWTDDPMGGGGGDDATWGGYWADYDGDGLEDLATVGTHLMRIYHNDGYDGIVLTLRPVYSKSWSSLVGADASIDGRTGAWGDIDGDGKLDVVLGGVDGMVLIHNLGGDTFANEDLLIHTPPLPDLDASPDTSWVISVALADADGDGDVDLAVGSYTHPTHYFENDGHGKLTQTSWEGTIGGEGTEWCNVNGSSNPLPELFTSGAGFVDAFDHVTSGKPGAKTRIADSTYFIETRCGDLDGDHDLDLFSNGWGEKSGAWRNGSSNVHSFTSVWTDPAAAPFHAHGVDLGDIDGDGKLDAVVSGDGYQGTFTIQPFKNTSTNTNQNIGFQPLAVPSVTYKGAAFAYQSRDVELGNLPPIKQ